MDDTVTFMLTMLHEADEIPPYLTRVILLLESDKVTRDMREEYNEFEQRVLLYSMLSKHLQEGTIVNVELIEDIDVVDLREKS